MDSFGFPQIRWGIELARMTISNFASSAMQAVRIRLKETCSISFRFCADTQVQVRPNIVYLPAIIDQSWC